MEVLVNGEARDIPEGGSLLELLTQLGFVNRSLAIAVNGTVVPRSQQEERELSSGDQVELIQAVGGG
jgi:thiamine biosynthesis protein ThiS